MAQNKKEDDKIEKMIRGILKLPENRKCINCNNLGPQYVCTTFLTFICTNCSGIHREFTHRVKSISMAKFTLEEVNALLAAGNERASQIYFKTWDPQRHSKPDSRDLYKLRTFIKHVYVDRKFTGEKSVENPIRKEDSGKNQSSSAHRYGSTNSNYGDRYDRYKGGGMSSYRAGSDDRIMRFCYEEGKSPGYYSLDKSRSGVHRRSSARFEVVDDRIRDGDTRKGKRLPRLMSADFKVGGMSVDVQYKADKANSLEGGHLAGDQFAGKSIKKDSSSRNPSPTAVKPITVKSKHGGTDDSKPTEPKVPDSRNPITSTTVKPPDARPELTPPANDDGNWASFDSSAEETPPPKPMNTLEALLFELSTPAPVAVGSEQAALVPAPTPTPEPSSNFHSGIDQLVESKLIGTIPTQSSGTESLVEPTVRPATSLIETAEQAPPSTAQQTPDSDARKELPADLFTAFYRLGPGPVRGWTAAPPYGYSNHMQYYPNPMVSSSFQPYAACPTAARSKNPFDVAFEPLQEQLFPAVAPMQGGSFNVPVAPTSVGVRPFKLRPPLFPSPMPASFSHGPYMGQEGFGTMNPNQVIRYSGPSVTYPPPVGGNPFG